MTQLFDLITDAEYRQIAHVCLFSKDRHDVADVVTLALETAPGVFRSPVSFQSVKLVE